MNASEHHQDWQYSTIHDSACKIIEENTLWGQTICCVWLPGHDSMVRIPASRLKSLESAGPGSPDNIAYMAAAARVTDALTQDVLLAPIESSVIPLPHQIHALSRAIADDRVRYLLADEVGLGKTIESGLILSELKMRGLVKRTLVVVPKGLVSQWVAEMATHFNELFQPILAEDYQSLQRLTAINRVDAVKMHRSLAGDGSQFPHPSQNYTGNPEHQTNPFSIADQIVVSMDSVKPAENRSDAAANQRFEDLVAAGWDLIIVDEAHRLGGSTDQVARFKLGQGLSSAAPYLLLLTATPHQGKSDAFRRLLSILDAEAFIDLESITRNRVQPYVIRTEKRLAIDAEGQPLFKPRLTQLVPVTWLERHCRQQLLYQAVTEYVREGYNQAMLQKRSYVGFLMLLMQRLVVSSTSAIRTTLERRKQLLEVPEEQLSLFPLTSEEEWADMTGQEQIDHLLSARLKALKNERAEVQLLLEAAAHCESAGADAKADALLEWLYNLQAEEGDSELKALIFTEFVATQKMLCRFLSDRGFTVVCLNGSMDMNERLHVQEAFARDARILVSTDAGGEGLNLQFCHVVINYDIPWNPMRLEQRIGRVDRIGQNHPVRAINLILQDSVEHRVREVLERKLAVIFAEFGIDKTSDVLDSALAGSLFDELYVEAILDPEKVEESVDKALERLREQARDARTSASTLGATEALSPEEAQRLLSHPLPHWVERMTLSYLKAHGGKAELSDHGWRLTWPDGQVYEYVVFSSKEHDKSPAAWHLTLADPRVRELAMQLRLWAPGQPIPAMSIPGIPAEIAGFWSLWQISIIAESIAGSGPPSAHQRRIMPLFFADEGMVYKSTARSIWDVLIAEDLPIRSYLDTESSQSAYTKMHQAAEEQGKPIYESLVQEHRNRIKHEREKSDYSFNARRKAIARIGLPEVRNYRLNQLAQEKQVLEQQIEQRSQILPELKPLIIIRVAGDGLE